MIASLTDGGFRPPPDADPSPRPGVLVAARFAATRRMLAAHLTGSGFEVWTAGDGVQALDVYVRHSGEIGAVVADADLPDLPGVAFVGRFRRHFPGVPVSVLTADPFGAAAGELAATGAVVVSKPVHLRHLAETVRTLMSAAGD